MVSIGMKDQSTVIEALRVAEEVYRKDAATMRVDGQDRIAEQFERQAKDAMILKAWLEERS